MPPHAMPPVATPWLVWTDDEGDVYYENTQTGDVSWEKPGEHLATRRLPAPVHCVPLQGCDWLEVLCDDGKVFWHKPEHAGASQPRPSSSWVMPAEVQQARTAAAEAAAAAQQRHQQLAAQTAYPPPPAPPPGPPPPAVTMPQLGAYEEEDDPTFDEEDIAPVAPPQPTAPPPQPTPIDADAAKAREAEAKAAAAAIAESYRQLLQEVGVSAHSTWAAVLPRLSADHRFRAVPSLSQRRSLFDAYVKELKTPAGAQKANPPTAGAAAAAAAAVAAKESAARKRKAQEAQLLDRERRKAEELRRRQDYRTLLAEAIKDGNVHFADWAATLARDPLGRGTPTSDDGVLPAAQMEVLFEEHTKELVLRYAQHFKQLLSERLNITHAGPDGPLSSLEAAERMLGHDARWQRCMPSDRQALWYAHCAALNAVKDSGAKMPSTAANAPEALAPAVVQAPAPVPVLPPQTTDDLLQDLQDE
jgi:FF domain